MRMRGGDRPKQFQRGGENTDTWDASRAAPSSLAALMGQMQPAPTPVSTPPSLAQQGATGALQGGQQWAPPAAASTPAAAPSALAALMQSRGAVPTPVTPPLAQQGAVGSLQGGQQWMPPAAGAQPGAGPGAFTAAAPGAGLGVGMGAPGTAPPMGQAAMQQALMAQRAQRGGPGAGASTPYGSVGGGTPSTLGAGLPGQQDAAAQLAALQQQRAALSPGATPWNPPQSLGQLGGLPLGAPGVTGPVSPQAAQWAASQQQNQLAQQQRAALSPAAAPPIPAPAPVPAAAAQGQMGSAIPAGRSAATIPPPVGGPALPQRAAPAVPAGSLGTYAKGGAVKKGRTFNSAAAAAENLPTHPGAKKLAKGGVLHRKPKVAKAALPPPAPPYGDNAATAPAPIPPAGTAPFRRGGKMAKGGKWIQGAIKKPGALHEQLGVPKDEKIPAKKLAKAAGASGKLGQRARLAQTLGGLRKSKGGKCDEPEKMAAGGAAKQRKGFPNTNPPPKKFAEGGKIRGCGAATKGCQFSGIY